MACEDIDKLKLVLTQKDREIETLSAEVFTSTFLFPKLAVGRNGLISVPANQLGSQSFFSFALDRGRLFS